MVFTYSGDPSASTLDEVRFLSQMTDSGEVLLSDAEITYIISKEGDATSSAARCCEILAVRYSREADVAVGANSELVIKFSQLSGKFSAMAKELRTTAGKAASPWMGSISISEKDDQEDRDDRVIPAFSRDQFNDDIGTELLPVQDWNNEGPRN